MIQQPITKLIDSCVAYGFDTAQINSKTVFTVPQNKMIKDNDFNHGEEVKSIIVKPERLLEQRKPTNLYDAVYHINEMINELPSFGATELHIPRVDFCTDYKVNLAEHLTFICMYNKCLQLHRSEGSSNKSKSTIFDESGKIIVGNLKVSFDSRETTWYDCTDKEKRDADTRLEDRVNRLKVKLNGNCKSILVDRVKAQIKEIGELGEMLPMLEEQMISGLTNRYKQMVSDEIIEGNLHSYIELLDTEGKLFTDTILKGLLINLGVEASKTKKWIENYKRTRKNSLQLSSKADLDKFCKHQIQIRKKYIAEFNKDLKELKGKERKEEYESELTKEFRAKFMGEDKVELTKRDKNEVYSCPMLQTEILIRDGKYYEVRWGSMPKEISRAKASEILTEENKLNPEYKETIIR